METETRTVYEQATAGLEQAATRGQALPPDLARLLRAAVKQTGRGGPKADRGGLLAVAAWLDDAGHAGDAAAFRGAIKGRSSVGAITDRMTAGGSAGTGCLMAQAAVLLLMAATPDHAGDADRAGAAEVLRVACGEASPG